MITTSCLRLRSGGSPIRAGPPEDPLRGPSPNHYAIGGHFASDPEVSASATDLNAVMGIVAHWPSHSIALTVTHNQKKNLGGGPGATATTMDQRPSAKY